MVYDRYNQTTQHTREEKQIKYKTTRKDIKSRYKVYKVGYCNLQSLLNTEDPFAYSTRAEGWACDYYYIGHNMVISTGYAPIGKDVPYELTQKYEKEASKILCETYDYNTRKEALDKLIEKLALDLVLL